MPLQKAFYEQFIYIIFHMLFQKEKFKKKTIGSTVNYKSYGTGMKPSRKG